MILADRNKLRNANTHLSLSRNIQGNEEIIQLERCSRYGQLMPSIEDWQQSHSGKKTSACNMKNVNRSMPDRIKSRLVDGKVKKDTCAKNTCKTLLK